MKEKEVDDIFSIKRRNNKKDKRLSGKFSLDWDKEKEEMFKPRTFIFIYTKP